MKITCVLGSAKVNGNSAMLAKRFCGKAQELGAEVQTFLLNDLDYRGCQGCNACKSTLDRCVEKDDLEPVLDSIRECDVLVMASPVYYGSVSGQLKCFIDRTYSYLGPDFLVSKTASRLEPGKKLVFVLTQAADAEDAFDDIFPKYRDFFSYYGFAESTLIRGCGVSGPGASEERDDLMKLADETAERLAA